MVKKLKGRHVIQAWVGSFIGLFHRDLAGINERLMETGTMHGDGLLVSFGSHYPFFLHESASLKLQEYKLVEPRLKPITIESSRRLIGSAT